MRRVVLFAVGLGAFCVTNLHAQSGGRDLPQGFRSLAGVTVNRDSAVTIRTKLGTTRERHAGSYTAWCYLPSDTSHHSLLELMSDASDMGTPGLALNVIRVRADAPSEDRNGCAPLRDSTELSTPAGLRLGLSAERIEQLLGPPTRSRADSLIYYYDAKRYLLAGTPEYETWDTLEYRESCFDAGPPFAYVEATVTIVLHDGRAVELRIERYDQSVC